MTNSLQALINKAKGVVNEGQVNSKVPGPTGEASKAAVVTDVPKTPQPGTIKLNLGGIKSTAPQPAARPDADTRPAAPLPIPNSSDAAGSFSSAKAESVAPAQSADIEAGEFNHPDMKDKLEISDVASFNEAIGIIKSSMEYPDLVANATRNILLQLREKPEFVKLLQPADFQLMIRALRTSHGMVVSSKVNNRNKRKKNENTISELDAAIGDIEFTTE